MAFILNLMFYLFFFFKQKTAYEMRISDWSSDVCSSDLIGEWARDKFMRYALCPADGPPFLWDPAPPAKRLSSPWISDNVAAPISTMQGGLPPWMNIQGDFAKQIKKALVHFGIEKQPLGIDVMELPMLRDRKSTRLNS